jgi:hypothetical protein
VLARGSTRALALAARFSLTVVTMFRFVEIPLPTTSTEAKPEEVVIVLGPGEIRRWWVMFPAACALQAHVKIYHHEHQILPRGEGESLYGDDYTFVIEDSYRLVEEPFEVVVRGWNEGTSYTRTPVVGVSIEPIPEVTTESLLQRLLRSLTGE